MTIPFRTDLSGKTVVVTGGGGVLCGHMARTVAECGAKVAVLDLRESAAEQVAKSIVEAGGKSIGIACDVLKKQGIETANAIINDTLGAVDILINGAGGNHPSGTTSNEFMGTSDLDEPRAGTVTFYDLDPEGFNFVFNINFLSTFLATQVFTKDMARRGAGVVINISSMNAFVPLTKVPAYSAAKAAVSNFTRWLAVHMSKVGIRVNAIAPGFFQTDQNRALLMEQDGSLTKRGETIVEHTPLGRFGRPEDLDGVLLWLLSESAASFVTGVIVPVDGGFSAFSGV